MLPTGVQPPNSANVAIHGDVSDLFSFAMLYSVNVAIYGDVNDLFSMQRWQFTGMLTHFCLPLRFRNQFLPTVPTFTVRESEVSRHNRGTSGAYLKPLRDDSALRALSSLRGLRPFDK